jgi:hypothetical protein
VLFLGSAQWLGTGQFDDHDLVALQRHRDRITPGLCVPKTPSTLCDQVILADQATDARPSSYAVPRKIGRLG